MSPGSHRLFVEYGSGVQVQSGSAPLVLDYLLVQNLTIPSSSTPLSSTPLASPSTTSTTSTQAQIPGSTITGTEIANRAGLPKGAIAAVVIGSAVGLAVIILIIMWIIRRRFIKLRGSEMTEVLEPIPRMASEDGQADHWQGQPGRDRL